MKHADWSGVTEHIEKYGSTVCWSKASELAFTLKDGRVVWTLSRDGDLAALSISRQSAGRACVGAMQLLDEIVKATNVRNSLLLETELPLPEPCNIGGPVLPSGRPANPHAGLDIFDEIELCESGRRPSSL